MKKVFILFSPKLSAASTTPLLIVSNADLKISEEFSDEVHFGLFIIETKNGEDILSKDNLFEIFKSTEKLREEDSQKKLSPKTISDTEHLFKYVDSETGAQVNGILTIADVVNNILIIDPKY